MSDLPVSDAVVDAVREIDKDSQLMVVMAVSEGRTETIWKNMETGEKMLVLDTDGVIAIARYYDF